MLYVVDSKTMKDIDSYTINEIGIVSEVLMERAALKVCERLEKFFKQKVILDEKKKIIVVCGQGNNGADGMAAARILHARDFHADIMLVSDKLNESAQKQLDIAKKTGVNVYHKVDYNEYNVVIDAMFGIGLSRNIEGSYKEEIEKINNSDIDMVMSVDIPSGISADDGNIMGSAVKADYTVTFGVNKQGLILYPGCEYAGNVKVVDIGFSKKAIEWAIKKNNKGYSLMFNKNSYKEYLPVRKNESNKGSYGRVLVIAGSKNMSGACYLSAHAAYRAGVGLVKVLTDKENRIILQSMLPEAVIGTYDYQSIEKDDNGLGSFEKQLLDDLKRASSVVIGPGMGNNVVTEKILKYVFENVTVPTVVDADAINVMKSVKFSKLPERMVMTPHIKEMAVFLDKNVSFVKDNMLMITDFVKDYIQCDNHVLVLKDARTIVFDNKHRYINTSGNNGMSTGGSGDVLSGIIAAFLAGGLSCMQAAMIGVYVHGLSGDHFYEENNAYSLLAKDIIEALKYVL